MRYTLIRTMELVQKQVVEADTSAEAYAKAEWPEPQDDDGSEGNEIVEVYNGELDDDELTFEDPVGVWSSD